MQQKTQHHREAEPDTSSGSALHYVNDHMPGYTRRREGESFSYYDERGRLIKGKHVLKRIAELVIPPMWEDVWICKLPWGHIQATGRDARGRKQYIYHPLWHVRSNDLKYHRLLDFARALPSIRKQVKSDLRRRSWGRAKVLALAVALMDEMHLRVGNKLSEKERETYGLTTLRRKHLHETGQGLVIKYKAKSGKMRKLTLAQPRLIRLVKECSELPGYEVFRYESEGKYIPISSQDVNHYLREITAMEITAKDFRTWGGTVLTVEMEPVARQLCAEHPRKKLDTTLVRMVADQLGNTVSVCRNYYIHPGVLNQAVMGGLSTVHLRTRLKNAEWYSRDELVVIHVLKKLHRIPLALPEVLETSG